MGTLMELPPDTVIYPGHADDHDRRARVGRQRASSASGAGWTRRAREPCTALGEPATLVLLGADYDGGTKAWVRWADGSDDIVPGPRPARRDPTRLGGARLERAAPARRGPRGLPGSRRS